MTSNRKKTKKPYKKKLKGVKYIALKLKKYFGKKYPKYTDALPKARELFADFKAQGQKVTVKGIFERTRKKQVNPFKKKAAPITAAPELPTELSELSNFFQLSEYPARISTAPNDLFFRSTISPIGLEDIQGGTEIDYSEVYEEYFKDFVNYINRLMSMTDPSQKIYENEWFVRCKEPEFDKETGRWISLIVSVDANGEQDDTLLSYGFDPSDPSKQPDEELLGLPSRVGIEPSREKPSEGKKTSGQFKGTSEQELELKLTKEKARLAEAEAKKLTQENRKKEIESQEKQADLEAFKLGLITREEYRKKWS